MFTQTKNQLQEKKMLKQITKRAAVLVLAVGLLTSAAAQSDTNKDFTRNISLTGIETAAGTFDPMSNISYGNAFVLNSLKGSEELETHHFTISLDYSCALDYSEVRCEVNSHFPVTGGSWSLVVFRDNVYAGTLYGRVAGGAIDVVTTRSGEPGFRQMQIKLQATGGLGRFARRGGANISGVYEAITDAVSNRTTGSLNLNSRL